MHETILSLPIPLQQIYTTTHVQFSSSLAIDGSVYLTQQVIARVQMEEVEGTETVRSDERTRSRKNDIPKGCK